MIRSGARMALWGGAARPPYRTELEYIESTGTQWIDTGVPPSTTHTKMTVDYAFSAPLSQTWTDQWMGAGSSSYGKFNLGIGSAIFRGYLGRSRFDIISQADSDRHVWSLENLGTAYTASIDNTVVTGSVSRLDDIPQHICLNVRGGSEADYLCSGKCYAFKIEIGGVLVRDLIPVLDWSGVPCMYDRVSGALFYNAGTGSFSYGADSAR